MITKNVEEHVLTTHYKYSDFNRTEIFEHENEEVILITGDTKEDKQVIEIVNLK